MTDVEVDDFYRRRDAGELISNPMTRVEYIGGPHTTGTWTHHFYYNGIDRTNYNYAYTAERLLTHAAVWNADDFTDTFGYLLPSTTDLSSVFDELQTAVSAKVGSGDTQSLVTLAESRKTGNMLAKAGKFLLRPISDARKILNVTRRMMSDAQTRAKVFDLAGSLWLEARYGWRPFILDTIAHCEAIRTPRPVRKTFRVSKAIPASAPGSFQVLMPATLVGQIVKEVKGEATAKIRCGQTVDYRNSIDLRVLQFGGYDILGTAWELIPYSFVVDWFINIGDSLQALQAFVVSDERVGFSVVEYNLSLETRIYIDGPLEWTNGSNVYVCWDCPVNDVVCHETLRWKERVIPSSFMPSLQTSVKLDWPKVVDLALLLNQLRR
jgi:hypothetical protein